MIPGFVSGVPVQGGARSFSGEATCAAKRTLHVAESKRSSSGSARMMVDNPKKEKSLLDWVHDKIMHNYGNDYGFETYFKPAQEAREEEMKRVRDEVDSDKGETKK